MEFTQVLKGSSRHCGHLVKWIQRGLLETDGWHNITFSIWDVAFSTASLFPSRAIMLELNIVIKLDTVKLESLLVCACGGKIDST